MGCVGRQASLGPAVSLRNDQHVPDQHGPAAGPPAAEHIQPFPHPSSARLQQGSTEIFGCSGAAARFAVLRSVRLSVPPAQNGNDLFLCLMGQGHFVSKVKMIFWWHCSSATKSEKRMLCLFEKRMLCYSSFLIPIC